MSKPMTAKELKGIVTALSMPFRADGEIDQLCFKKLVECQVKEGIDGFVINGTTGENPCLSHKEQEQVFLWAVEGLRDEGSPSKPFMIANIGTNSTQKTLEIMKKPFLMRAGAFLAVVPYYNKPPQRGLIKHFKTLADKSCGPPVILYNVPSRTAQGLSLESLVELSQHPNIIGIKEASGDLNFGKQIIEHTQAEEFSVLSGDDETALELCAMGANGVISVVSHIIGKEMQLLLKTIKTGKAEEKASSLNEYKEKYGQLLKALYAETNPIGIKMALKLMGLFETANMRLPLVEMQKETARKLSGVLQEQKLLHKTKDVL